MIGLAALGGAGIGYYMTSLPFAAGGVTAVGGQVYNVGEYVTIVIPTDKIFDVNSDDLLPEATPVLNSALSVLNRYSEV